MSTRLINWYSQPHMERKSVWESKKYTDISIKRTGSTLHSHCNQVPDCGVYDVCVFVSVFCFTFARLRIECVVKWQIFHSHNNRYSIHIDSIELLTRQLYNHRTQSIKRILKVECFWGDRKWETVALIKPANLSHRWLQWIRMSRQFEWFFFLSNYF